MKKNEIIRRISVDNVSEWDFIVRMLDKECIEKTAENFSEGNHNLPFSEFGLEEDRDEVADCLNVLMRKASKKMWNGISKSEANNLIESMNAIGAISVKMPDLGNYTVNDIIKSWKAANEVED